MLSISNFVLVVSVFCSLAIGADTSLIAAHRQEASEQTSNALAALRKRGTGDLPTKLGKSLYWFGNFSVGESSDLKLVIDTGSSDCILNNGLYVAQEFKLQYLASAWQI